MNGLSEPNTLVRAASQMQAIVLIFIILLSTVLLLVPRVTRNFIPAQRRKYFYDIERVERITRKLFFVVIPVATLCLAILFYNGLPLISLESTKVIMFIVDIICLSLAVRWSGGLTDSPFTPMLFLLPALAAILKEPPIYLWIYTALVALSTILNYISYGRLPEEFIKSFGFKLVYLSTTILSLVIATYIGLITQSL